MRHFALFALFNFGFSDIVIHLPDGSIRGKQSVTLTHKKFYSFEKIPYAAPPIGELRFQAPILPKKWDGVLNTTRSDAICYQVAGDFSLESEDCLYLNVYTPKVDALLPVIFYIHGGGFIGGACTSSICGPEFFIDYNVVVVTINYRLGPFGFLSTQDTEIPGNNGLKDQQLALKWARNNIILFGGDPSRITIVGQSAGSASVTYQILNKNSKGLFWAAICQSGSFLSPWSFQRNSRQIAFQTASYINETFKTNNDSKELRKFLLTVTADELDKASYRVHQTETLQNRQISQGYFYAPVLEVEHEDAFITRKMFGDLKIGNFVKVPIIIGITSEEALEDANDLSLLKNIMKTYDDNLDWLVPHDLNVKDKQKRKMIGEIIRSFYTGSKLQDDLSAGIRFFSDNSFTRSVIKHAQLQSKFTNVYFYQFSYDGMIGNVSTLIKGAGKVAHTEELRYMWRIDFQGYNNTDIEQFPEDDVVTHRRLLTLWTNFAKTLNPNSKKFEMLENISWPSVATGRPKDLLYLNIDKELTIKSYPKIAAYLGWNMIYDFFGEEEFDTF
ncbi:Esterase-6-like Protein [Tribolium castaneum]|uniref:Carboxylic ester hydrolase n=3 Tax=Tribolium castaneum TaxID=7070 RepID=A0A139WMJ7_TRICA|nr:PREDICTED: venom carboxylesterase-6-like isoform X1 [Tribolium castaneum]KYB29071.1 Esterase-6-like Protein [Tribolium castaneum]|eukprot:XP_015840855.1 PREDICTED: venom carboxylesterase-6-like isoform X1 [Tribolium castaneum]